MGRGSTNKKLTLGLGQQIKSQNFRFLLTFLVILIDIKIIEKNKNLGKASQAEQIDNYKNIYKRVYIHPQYIYANIIMNHTQLNINILR